MDEETYILRSSADAAITRIAGERDILKESIDALQTELRTSDEQLRAANDRASAAEAKAASSIVDSQRLVTEAQADARVADAARDAAERALSTEQAARLEAESRCTVLMAEVRRPLAIPVEGPKGWRITMDKDGADNTRGYRIEVDS